MDCGVATLRRRNGTCGGAWRGVDLAWVWSSGLPMLFCGSGAKCVETWINPVRISNTRSHWPFDNDWVKVRAKWESIRVAAGCIMWKCTCTVLEITIRVCNRKTEPSPSNLTFDFLPCYTSCQKLRECRGRHQFLTNSHLRHCNWYAKTYRIIVGHALYFCLGCKSVHTVLQH